MIKEGTHACMCMYTQAFICIIKKDICYGRWVGIKVMRGLFSDG